MKRIRLIDREGRLHEIDDVEFIGAASRDLLAAIGARGALHVNERRVDGAFGEDGRGLEVTAIARDIIGSRLPNGVYRVATASEGGIADKPNRADFGRDEVAYFRAAAAYHDQTNGESA